MKATQVHHDNLPDTLPGLLILQHRLSSQISLKRASGFMYDTEARDLEMQNNCLRKQLLELLSLTDRLAMLWKSDNFSSQTGLG
jgi:hypothetical protein